MLYMPIICIIQSELYINAGYLPQNLIILNDKQTNECQSNWAGASYQMVDNNLHIIWICTPIVKNSEYIFELKLLKATGRSHNNIKFKKFWTAKRVLQNFNQAYIHDFFMWVKAQYFISTYLALQSSCMKMTSTWNIS